MINVPAAIWQLALENVANTAPLQLSIHFAAPVHENYVIRAQRAIDNQFATPVAIRLLLPQKVFLRASDCVRDLFLRSRVGFRRIRERARQHNQSRCRIRHRWLLRRLCSFFCLLAGDVTVAGTHTVKRKNLTPSASGLWSRTKIEFDRLPGIAALRLKP